MLLSVPNPSLHGQFDVMYGGVSPWSLRHALRGSAGFFTQPMPWSFGLARVFLADKAGNTCNQGPDRRRAGLHAER